MQSVKPTTVTAPKPVQKTTPINTAKTMELDEKAVKEAESKKQRDEREAASKLQRMQIQQELMAQQAAAKASAKAERAAKHEEMLREHAIRREEKRKKKLEQDAKDNDSQSRQLSVTVDVAGLKDALQGYLSKFGEVHTSSGREMWSFRVTYDQKDSLPKALQEPLLEIPVRVVLEQNPVPLCSVQFPYLWLEEKKTSATSFELKSEVMTVFNAKMPAWAKPHFVSFRSGVVIVTFHTTEARDEAIRLTATGTHNWVIKGKQVPSLLPHAPSLKRKRNGQ